MAESTTTPSEQQQPSSLITTVSNPSVSRPNSLLGPEKEPVNFVVNLVGAPPEVEQLVEHIKLVAEQFLYHWKTFPIGNIYTIFISNKYSKNFMSINFYILY